MDKNKVNKIMQDDAIPENRRAETDALKKNRHVEDGSYSERISPKARKKFKFHYTQILNFIYTIIAFSFIGLVELGYITLSNSGFYCKDPKLSHSFQGDTVSTTSLIITSLVMPIFIFALSEGFKFGWRAKRFLGRTLRWLYEFLIYITVMLFIVEACKLFAAELRPHFFATCEPDMGINCTEGEYITEYKCMNKKLSRSFLIDAGRSFPSGHASVSMYATVFTAVYVHYQMEVDKLGSLFKPFILSVVCSWGPIVSITRVLDYRHFWWDVVVGIALGVIFGLYGYFSVCHKFRNTKIKSRPNSFLENSSTAALYDTRVNSHIVNAL